MCCLNRDLNLKILKMSYNVVCMMLHAHTKSVVDQTDHFANAFVCEKVMYGFEIFDDIMTFESLQLAPFCLEKSRTRKEIFYFFSSIFSGSLLGIR